MTVAFARGAAEIARRDPVMAGLVRRAGPPKLRPRSRDPFQALVRAIVYQQLAGSAAAAIHARLAERLGGAITVSNVRRARAATLRAAGLSEAKVLALKDLAAKVASGAVSLDARAQSDEELIEHLVAVRGVGRWTAEMFLLFQLRRPDVWPVGDFGVRKGYGLAYGLVAMPTPTELRAHGERFRPYRSVAAWYCWRAVELTRQTSQPAR